MAIVWTFCERTKKPKIRVKWVCSKVKFSRVISMSHSGWSNNATLVFDVGILDFLDLAVSFALVSFSVKFPLSFYFYAWNPSTITSRNGFDGGGAANKTRDDNHELWNHS